MSDDLQTDAEANLPGEVDAEVTVPGEDSPTEAAPTATAPLTTVDGIALHSIISPETMTVDAAHEQVKWTIDKLLSSWSPHSTS